MAVKPILAGHTLLLCVLAAVVLPSRLYSQQSQRRMAGLERNAEYVSAIAEERQLKNTVDSLSGVVTELRETLADNSADYDRLSAEILQLESNVINLNNRRSAIAGRITAIESEWLAVNSDYNDRDIDPDIVTSTEEITNYADLVRNSYFRRALSDGDYSTLLMAQEYEVVAMNLLAEYDRCYRNLEQVKAEYDAAKCDAAAESLMTQLYKMQYECTKVSDLLSEVWNRVYDNKSYIYELILDKDGCEDVLLRAEKLQAATRQHKNRESGCYASDAVTAYCLGKRCLLSCEIDIANTAGLKNAADSLSAAASLFSSVQYDYKPVNIARRNFVVYSSLTPSSQTYYSTKRPIPECEVYSYGTIYRIRLERTNKPQPQSRFNGMQPVYCKRNPDNSVTYYAGGYRTIEDAENGLNVAKRLGFGSAVIAAWFDGEYGEGTEELERLAAKSFIVEIKGADELPARVRDIIASVETSLNISRTGKGLFVVGNFTSIYEARKFAEDINSIYTSLTASVSEIDDMK